MRKYLAVACLTTFASVAIATPVVAADLSNGSGQSCPEGSVGTYHFVNNQTGGASAGTLTATFSDGTVWVVGPSAVNRNTQHFLVESEGALVSASTDLAGRLVLSDFSCGDVKKD
ncbi:hypothetical protein [Jiangella asiatica]|uniref:Uncharacterized protein n=1 Tax=Jiangella asiatica TaxID=2530372 RepID=A0A4R5CGV6_9ACTN|nr:hypothetical protein [Jiangella asiatica]TDD98945.1 hypothetical protein E1269_28100 [Jiangella asiatica]